METYKLFDAEYKFVSIIWGNESINSTELVKLCGNKLYCKKSTYTALKKICECGVLQNRNATVAAFGLFS